MAKVKLKNLEKYYDYGLLDAATNGIEFTYMDLCYMILEDLDKDECMPEDERVEAKETLASLMDILIPYSG